MSDDKCTGCGAPAAAGAMACEFCGKALKAPKGVEEELAMVREQSAAAQKLAAKMAVEIGGEDDANGDSDAEERRLAVMVAFWSSAFMPTTVSAAKLSLQTALAAMRKDADESLLNALESRANVLADLLEFHPDATDGDRAEAKRVRVTVFERIEDRRLKDAKENWFPALFLWVMMSGLASFLALHDALITVAALLVAALISVGGAFAFYRLFGPKRRSYAERA